MRSCRISVLIAAFVLLVAITTAVQAADPTLYIAATRRDTNGVVVSINPVTDKQGVPQPPLLLPGEYVIVTGLGFPAGQSVQAELVSGARRLPLAYQDLTTAITQPQVQPQTDASGAFRDLAFTLPVAGQITGASGQLVVTVSAVSLQTPVAVVTEATEGGDRLAVGFGAGFSAVAALLIFLMLRGLPTYPRSAGGKRVTSNE